MDHLLVVEMISLVKSLIVAVAICYKAYQTRQCRLAEVVEGSSHRLFTIQILVRVSKTRKDCRFGEPPGRTAVWWGHFKNGLVAPEEWNENLCMSKESFNELCFLFRPVIEKQNRHLRKSISVEKQVTVVLHYSKEDIVKLVMPLEVQDPPCL